MTDDNRLVWLAQRSLDVIEGGQGPDGGYLASPTFPNYRYSWLRDGAFIADAMSRAGRAPSAERFFAWCSSVITAREAKVEQLVATAAEHGAAAVAPDDHLHARYTLDGREADEPWWTFQLDGYGVWLWALSAHLERDGNPPATMRGVQLTVRYLTAFWDQPSYDWWEENISQRHVSTLASVWAGLDAVSRLPGLDPGTNDAAMSAAAEVASVIGADGIHQGRLAKWLGGDDIDASLLACIEPFRLYPADHPVARSTVTEVEDALTRGGVYRYRDDTYYGGGEWVLLAGFLGLCRAAAGETGRATELLVWMAEQADQEGHLPEQVDGHLLHPHRKEEWVQRWGPSANPLLWSHAMYLSLAIELGVVAPTTENAA